MKRVDNALARAIEARGVAVVWELAAAAAIAPYVVGPFFGGLRHSAVVAPQPEVAASLAATLILLAMLRSAVATAFSLAAAPQGDGYLELANKPPRSPSPGFAASDAIQSAVGDHQPCNGAAFLGLARFANYQAMAAYDINAARRVMTRFRQRFDGAVSFQRLPTQVNDDCFAIWFANGATSDVSAELRSVAYVMAQEVVDPDLTVAPDIHVAIAPHKEDDTFSSLLARGQASLVPLKEFAQPAKRGSIEATGQELAERFALEQALRRAVRDGQLSLRYQPFVDAASGAVAGAEALLRWTHPVLGEVPPTRFVPILEETGLVHEIGLWTINTGCRQLRDWRAAGNRDLRLAINLSAIQLQNRSLGRTLERTIASHGLVPSDIELELTETAAMEDRARTIEVFHDLRRLGFGIAIDDFGSGHSNLSYLRDLPFTKLKIDREFVTDIDTRPGSRAICKAMIELGAGLGISVLAEGAERYEEIATLRRLGCHVFQGFYFSRPLTAEQLTEKVADQHWIARIGSEVHRRRAELQKRMIT